MAQWGDATCWPGRRVAGPVLRARPAGSLFSCGAVGGDYRLEQVSQLRERVAGSGSSACGSPPRSFTQLVLRVWKEGVGVWWEPLSCMVTWNKMGRMGQICLPM